MRVGVDEAGKGPVLGSMFAAAVRAVPDMLPDGVGDSKGIAPAERERLDERIRAAADAVAIAEIPVVRIDDPETDMNTLTVAAHAEALSGVARDGLAGLVDAGDTDADRFGRRVAKRVDATLHLDAEHGADETDPLVGAASIVAKVARDSHVESLTEVHGEVGSGYPSDPTTRAFLAGYVDDHGDLPDCARASWSTCEDVLAAAEQSTLGEF
ncbi:ribonuclease HII [Haloarcula onubensis]|uniref:Ribonuclease HII n=1 Tax=Haloarcula onubensis TaxID=2950539 RepID=A0ABU2FPK8_9EURY|nr:ribonuclease HII [Halomicroarcula sp. S3CR25-11]MDS0282242.1 ribonuclease HII [Halomicroarcula sp. S3CR25-11]